MSQRILPSQLMFKMLSPHSISVRTQRLRPSGFSENAKPVSTSTNFLVVATVPKVAEPARVASSVAALARLVLSESYRRTTLASAAPTRRSTFKRAKELLKMFVYTVIKEL